MVHCFKTYDKFFKKGSLILFKKALLLNLKKYLSLLVEKTFRYLIIILDQSGKPKVRLNREQKIRRLFTLSLVRINCYKRKIPKSAT